MGAGFHGERVRGETVQKNAAGERFERAGNQFEERGFAAGVGAENGDEFTGLGLKAEGFKGEERGLRWIGSVGVADLLDAEAHIGVRARGIAGERVASGGAHAILLRSK